MLENNELRVGNLINVLNPNTDVWNIEATKGKTIMILQEKKGHHLLINNLKPIPLTEEWLLKFGFKEKVYNESYPKNRFKKDIFNIYYTNQPSFSGYVLCEDDFVIRGVEFVHQLQNLYFALTNEELEIKM